MNDEIDPQNHCSPSYVKWVLKQNYDLTGDLEITTCTDCGKEHRLCQVFESPDGTKKAYVCEQCTWELSDEQYDMYYKEDSP